MIVEEMGENIPEIDANFIHTDRALQPTPIEYHLSGVGCAISLAISRVTALSD